MKQFVVEYTDKAFSPRYEKYSTKPYAGPVAKEVADALEIMGCSDVKVVPFKGPS